MLRGKGTRSGLGGEGPDDAEELHVLLVADTDDQVRGG
jgi:hypothetical protein